MRLKNLLFCYVCLALMSVHTGNAQYIGYDYVEPFSATPLNGMLSAAPGGGTLGLDDGALKLTLSGASGARTAYFTLNQTLIFTKKLIVEFDWYTTNYAAGSGDEGQIQFRSSTVESNSTNNTLFTLFNKQGRNGEIGIIAGGPTGTALSTTVNEANRTFIPGPINTWYHVKVEFYRGERVCVTITGTGGNSYAQQVMLPLPSGFTLDRLARIYFNMTRTGNITWDTRIRNLGVKIADGDPTVNASNVTVSSQYDLIYANGGTSTLSAVVDPFDVSTHAITWSVDNGLAAILPGSYPSWNATLSAANAGGGTVIVTATSATAGVIGTKAITISAVPIPLNDIQISGPATVSVNSTITLTTSVGPGNAANKNVVWSSLNPGIATVSASGVVTGVSGGVATIQAEAADGGGAVQTHQVTVSVTNIEYIDMQGTRHIFYPSISTSNFTITPNILPSTASFKTLTWSSTDPAIATVDGSGTVTLTGGMGKAYIKASSTDGSGVVGWYYIERYAANPFTVFNDFESNTTPLSGGSRTSFENSYTYYYAVSGQSGGRSQTWTIASGSVPRGGVIDLRFDWYAPLVTTSQNSGVLSIQDANTPSTKILSFVADNYTTDPSRGEMGGGTLGNIRYLLGDYIVDGDAYPPVSISLQNVSALNRWYIIEVRFDFLSDELSFTFTDRSDPTKFDKVENIPLSQVFPPQASIGSLFFNGLRTATHNITFTTAIDNFGYTIVNAGLPTYEVTGLSLTGLDVVSPGEKILVYPKIAPLNAINKNVTFVSSDPSIATVVLDANGRAIVTGVSEGTAVIRATSVQKPGIFAEKTITVAPVILPQRQLEQLDRGLVAVRSGSGVFLSWRLLGTDPADVHFNLYKNNGLTPINGTPLDPAYTDFTDPAGTVSDTYSVAVLVGVNEIYRSKPVAVWGNQYKSIPVQKPVGYLPTGATYTNYTIYDGSTGDLDGDGEYEIVFLWGPSNMQDNSNSGLTGNVYIDAYKLDGTKLWGASKWIDLGRNIRAGAHYLPFLVFDFDGDGKAEIVVRTADGTTDTQGTMIGQDIRYANSDGFVLQGPEFVAVFEGATGKLLDYKPYEPERGDVRAWGDGQGNRADRFLAAVAYVDGVHPSAVMCRGYYTRTTLTAWDWNGKNLSKRWMFDSNVSGRQYTGQGNHNMSVADVDSDGKDEIIYGSLTIDDDGTAMYATGLGHGDAMHVGKFDPARPGIQVMSVHESPFPFGMDMHDGMNGNFIWTVIASGDIGRGNTADVDPNYSGAESWSSGGLGTFSAQGEKLGSSIGRVNMAIWWDGDTGRELLDGGSNPTVTKINPSGTAPNRNYGSTTLFTFNGTSTNGGSKNNPCLQADILGDWREEVILRVSGDDELRIYTTITPTIHSGSGAVPTSGIPTLMHDYVYRAAITWQNGGYNQPPHTGFFLGYNMENVTRTEGAAFTVTLDPNGGVFDDNTTAIKVISTVSGAFLTIPNVSKIGTTLIGWFFANGTPFDPTAVYAENIELKAAWTAPTAPQSFTAVAGDGQVILSWSAPTNDGGSPITGYLVSSDNGVTWVTAASATGHTFTGLTNGVSYTFLVHAVNIAGNGATASVSATPAVVIPPPTSFSVTVSTSSGGSASSDKSSAVSPGETVTLAVTPDTGYELVSIWVYGTGTSNALFSLSGTNLAFSMPACDVTIVVTFQYRTYQSSWNAAKAIIESADFSILQKDANTLTDVQFLLEKIINQLIAGTGFVISPYDIFIFDYNFQPATAGYSDNPSGVNGKFDFRVTPPNTGTSAYSGGSIAATPTANDVIVEKSLRAWTINGVLHISGLTPGKYWNVYSLTGVLISHRIADADEANIILPGQGMYIVTSGTESVIIIEN